MPASVKNKIRLGTIFLFMLVAIAGGTGIYYLVKLRQQSENILTANYESLQLSHQMQMALDSVLNGHSGYTDTIDHYLKLQESNITEQGEELTTGNLRSAYLKLKDGDTSQGPEFRKHLQTIISLNMKAIQKKSANAESASEKAVTIIITTVAVILLIGFTFIVNFPSVITDPIQKLTEAIKEISQKNYRHRIHIESKDEFGQLAQSFNEMAERLEYFESSNLNKILFEKARAEAVINSLKDASVGIDKNNTVLFANQQALQLLGMSAKNIIGANADDVAMQNDLFRFIWKEKSNTPFKIVVDNRENYFTKEVIQLEQGSGGSTVIVLNNITSFKELDVAKTNFIATISHELKTPLASSDFSLKLLENEMSGKLSEEQRELVNNLKEDNQRMLRILSELLNLSQVEAGKIQFNIKPVDVYQSLESSINTVSAAAKEKQIKIETVTDPDLPLIQGDPDKIVWVLNNFLINAIKYSPEKTVVEAEVKKTEKEVQFVVTDHGLGIEERNLSRIFERYYQVQNQASRKGSGIGLAICKEFVEAMGGTIWVKSKIGEGSSFGFSLPL